MIILELLGRCSWCLTKKEGESMNTRVCAVSFYHAETPRASIKQPWTTISHNTLRVRFYAFVGRFLKQLYLITVQTNSFRRPFLRDILLAESAWNGHSLLSLQSFTWCHSLVVLGTFCAFSRHAGNNGSHIFSPSVHRSTVWQQKMASIYWSVQMFISISQQALLVRTVRLLVLLSSPF